MPHVLRPVRKARPRTAPGRPIAGLFALAAALLLLLALPLDRTQAGEWPESPEGTVHVTPHRLSVNGQSTIPAAMFGVHNLKLTPELVERLGIVCNRYISQKPSGHPVIPGSGKGPQGGWPNDPAPKGVQLVLDCLYDRYQPALIVMHKDWKARLETLATQYAENSAKADFVPTLEFWNEPYLNWASRPAVNYDGHWFVPKSDPPTLKSTGESFDYLAWDPKKELLAVRNNGRAHYLASRYAHDYRRWKWSWKVEGKEKTPFKWEEGWKFQFRGEPLTMGHLPWIKDTTQRAYYSARFNEELYNRMLVVFGKTLKEKNPNTILVAGWDCNMWNEEWLPFHSLYKPTIDKAHPWIDGIAEHHYGCDTRMVGAEYEVIWTYGMTRHDKALKIYNTEAGGMADPEKPTQFQPNYNAQDKDAKVRGAFTYFVRDIIYLLAYSPDKAASRAWHNPQNTGVLNETFGFMRELRGELVYTRSPSQQLWCVASRRMDAKGGPQLCVLLFNDKREDWQGPVRIDPPADADLAAGVQVTPIFGGGKVRLESKPLAAPDAGKPFTTTVTLPQRSGLKFVFPLAMKKTARQDAPVISRQHPADLLLTQVTPEKPATTTVTIDAATRKAAKAAKLRLVHSGFYPASAQVLLNDKALPISFQGASWICEAPIDPKLLQASNTLEFRSTKGEGFFLCATSLVTLDDRPEHAAATGAGAKAGTK